MAPSDNRKLKVTVESDMDDVLTDSDRLGDSFEDVGDKAKGMGEHITAAFLKADVPAQQKAIEGLQKKVASLAQESLISDESLDKLDKARSKLDALRKAAKPVPVDVDPKVNFNKFDKVAVKLAELGGKAGEKFAGLFGDAMGGAAQNPAVGTGIALFAAGIVGILGNLIGPGIALAVLGGAAGVGIIGGVKLAMNNTAVQGSVKQLTDYIGVQMKDAAYPFLPALQNVMIRAKGIFAELVPNIRGIFAKSSTYLAPLMDGIQGFARAVGPAFERAVKSAEPIILALKDVLPGIGEAFAGLLNTISDHAPEAASLLRGIGFVVEDLIGFTSGLIDLTSAWYRGVVALGQASLATGDILLGWVPGLGGFLEKHRDRINELAGAMDKSGEAGRRGGSGVFGYATETQKASTAAKELADENFRLVDSLNKTSNAAIGTMRAADAVKASMKAGSEALKENGRTLNNNTEKGRANREALFTLAEQVNRHKNAVFSQTGNINKAAAASEKGRKKFIELAIGMGKTREDAIKLANKLIPLNKTYTAKVTETGVARVQGKLDKLLIQQQALKKGISISAAASAFNKNAYATGGYVQGPGSGTSDSINARLSNGEYVINAKATKKIGVQTLNKMNAAGMGDGIGMPFPVTAKDAQIMSLDEALSRVRPDVAAGMGYKRMMQVIRSAFPGTKLVSGFRPGSRTLSGNLSYHASGRAVDIPAIRNIANWLYTNYKSKTKELITPWRDRMVLNGRDHRFSGAVERQHGVGSAGNDHIHWAMDGITNLAPGLNVGFNRTGKTETVINKDLLTGMGVTINGDVHFHEVQDVKGMRDELIKLSRRNGGRAGLPSR